MRKASTLAKPAPKLVPKLVAKSVPKSKALPKKPAITRKKKRISDDEDDDDFNPENDDAVHTEAEESEAFPTDDESIIAISDGEASADDVPAIKKGGKTSKPTPAGKGVRLKYACKPVPCNIKVEPRDPHQDGGLAPISKLKQFLTTSFPVFCRPSRS